MEGAPAPPPVTPHMPTLRVMRLYRPSLAMKVPVARVVLASLSAELACAPYERMRTDTSAAQRRSRAAQVV
eukprot:scaffold1272_cov250-Pinguiococcus_pyrenoidosus.AAC.72